MSILAEEKTSIGSQAAGASNTIIGSQAGYGVNSIAFIKSLLYWVYKLLDDYGENRFVFFIDKVAKSDFDRIKAPDWVWPAFQESYDKFKGIQSELKQSLPDQAC